MIIRAESHSSFSLKIDVCKEMLKPVQDLPQSGYAVIVDGQVKTEFKTKEGAQNGARDLKRRFPMLQIKVYDAETKHIEDIELAKA
jgi:hypothetical protein